MIEDQPAKIVVVHYGDPVVSGFGGPENGRRIGELGKKERANGRQENCGGSGGSSDEAECANKQRGRAQDLEGHARAEPRDQVKSRDKDSTDAAGCGECVHFTGGDSDVLGAGEKANDEGRSYRKRRHGRHENNQAGNGGAKEFARLPEPAENGTLDKQGGQLIDTATSDDDVENRA